MVNSYVFVFLGAFIGMAIMCLYLMLSVIRSDRKVDQFQKLVGALDNNLCKTLCSLREKDLADYCEDPLAKLNRLLYIESTERVLICSYRDYYNAVENRPRVTNPSLEQEIEIVQEAFEEACKALQSKTDHHKGRECLGPGCHYCDDEEAERFIKELNNEAGL